MNRRNFIKGLLMASAAVVTGAQLIGEASPPRPGIKHATCELPKETRDLLGTNTGCYELTADGYLLFCGQSVFSVYGRSGGLSARQVRYKHMGGGEFREENYPAAFRLIES